MREQHSFELACLKKKCIAKVQSQKPNHQNSVSFFSLLFFTSSLVGHEMLEEDYGTLS